MLPPAEIERRKIEEEREIERAIKKKAAKDKGKGDNKGDERKARSNLTRSKTVLLRVGFASFLLFTLRQRLPNPEVRFSKESAPPHLSLILICVHSLFVLPPLSYSPLIDPCTSPPPSLTHTTHTGSPQTYFRPLLFQITRSYSEFIVPKSESAVGIERPHF